MDKARVISQIENASEDMRLCLDLGVDEILESEEGTMDEYTKGFELMEKIAKRKTDKLREALHDLLGPFDGRDPETDGPVDLVTDGVCVRKAQDVLAEVE